MLFRFEMGKLLQNVLTFSFRILTEGSTLRFMISSTRAFLKILPDVISLPRCRCSFKSKLNSVALVHKRTIPTERPPLVGEVSANFLQVEGVVWSAQRIPMALNLGFLDRSHLLVASNVSSRTSHSFWVPCTTLSLPRP
jgi:hypothetical protein